MNNNIGFVKWLLHISEWRDKYSCGKTEIASSGVYHIPIDLCFEDSSWIRGVGYINEVPNKEEFFRMANEDFFENLWAKYPYRFNHESEEKPEPVLRSGSIVCDINTVHNIDTFDIAYCREYRAEYSYIDKRLIFRDENGNMVGPKKT